MNRIEQVNIKQGTESARRFSNGNTLPLTSLPHALASFAPQTDSSRGSWFYHPKDRSFEGIRLTHQPSPWMGDFSYFCFMPQADNVYVSEDERYSGFRINEAKLCPHYMSIDLLRYKANISLAPTNSGAIIKLHFDESIKTPRFAILPANFDGNIMADLENNKIYGFTSSKNERPKNDKFGCYFVFSFNCNIYDPYVSDGKNKSKGTQMSGVAAGINVALDSKDVEISLAISYISLKQAKLNLLRETNMTFQECKDNAQKKWHDVLSLIDIKASEEIEKTFYSCLYRAFLYPTKFYELNEKNEPIHINPETLEIKEGVMYTNNGFWDTFRTVYPLYSLICPDLYREIVEGWLNFYDDNGYLPRWPSPSEAGCMPGTLIEPVLADAVVKDILTKEQENRALIAMLKNAEVESDNKLYGRKCVALYNKLGFVPYDYCYESVNETLDCAYGDYCIAVVAKKLGKLDIYEKYLNKSKNYKNLFDSSVGFMRAKNSFNKFRKEEFCPDDWGLDYTEASAWQTSLSVQHDILGLKKLYGNKKEFVAYLDKLFMVKPNYGKGGYGGEIHEMTEMAAVDFGQCAISNQPSFHIPYIYAELGMKNKSKKIVKKITDELFSSNDDGFPGDEDNGTMACWYIFSVLGLYPFCPSKGEYTLIGTSLKHAVIKTKNGNIDLKKLKGNKIEHKELISCVEK